MAKSILIYTYHFELLKRLVCLKDTDGGYLKSKLSDAGKVRVAGVICIVVRTMEAQWNGERPVQEYFLERLCKWLGYGTWQNFTDIHDLPEGGNSPYNKTANISSLSLEIQNKINEKINDALYGYRTFEDYIEKKKITPVENKNEVIESQKRIETGLQLLVDQLLGFPSKEKENEIFNSDNIDKQNEFYKEIVSKQRPIHDKYNRSILANTYKWSITCLKKGDIPKAKELATQAIQLDPSFVFAKSLLFYIEIEERNYGMALTIAEEILRSYPNYKEWLFLKAAVLNLLGKSKDSLALCNQIIETEINEEENSLRIILGNYYEDLHDFVDTYFSFTNKEALLEVIFVLKSQCLFNLKLYDETTEFIHECMNKDIKDEIFTMLFNIGSKASEFQNHFGFFMAVPIWNRAMKNMGLEPPKH